MPQSKMVRSLNVIAVLTLKLGLTGEDATSIVTVDTKACSAILGDIQLSAENRQSMSHCIEVILIV